MPKSLVTLVLLLALILLVVEATSSVTVYSKPNIRTSAQSELASPIWSGYIAASSISNPQPVVDFVNGSWIVQSVAPSKISTYSCQWVGIGGTLSGDQTLIQVGTESDSSNGAINYYAWYELVNANSVESPLDRNLYPIYANDVISAYVISTGTLNQWMIGLTDSRDKTMVWHWDKTVTYSSSQNSADWIEERPKLGGQLTTLADFGTASFGQAYTAQSGTSYARVGGTFAPIGSLTYASVTMHTTQDPSSPVLASPSALSGDGTSFTVTRSKVNTQVTFTLSPNPAVHGQTVRLSGTLKNVNGNPLYPAQVRVDYSTNGGGTWNFAWTLGTNSAGAFSKTFTAPGAGTYLIRVSYAGSSHYNPSSHTVTLTVH